MKILRLGIIVGITLIIILLLKNALFQKISSSTPLLDIELPKPTNSEQTLNYQIADFSIYVQEIHDLSQIKLYSNLEDKLTAANLITSKGCKSLVSAGFYTKEEKHIGYFYTNGTLIADKTNNAFYNGYFGLSAQNNAFITKVLPSNKELAIQSGPLLIYDGQAQKLNIANDEQARRVVVATNKAASTVYFLILVNTKSTLLGPNLEELPDMLAKFIADKKLDIHYALNLDGGAHSTFITNDVRVSELSPIGGYFCISTTNKE